MNSWNKADSYICDGNSTCPMIDNENEPCCECNNGKYGFCIGQNDLTLAQRLIKAGTEHRKFLRQIFVSVDISAPLYWWKEFDTYKIGTTANSTSTMHKILDSPLLKQSKNGFVLNKDVFELGDYCPNLNLIDDVPLNIRVWSFVDTLEQLRNRCLTIQNDLENKELSTEVKEILIDDFKAYWKELIRWLPENYLQTRTVTLNYENIYSIIKQRTNHKLSEWSGKSDNSFLSWARSLPYIKELFELEN